MSAKNFSSRVEGLELIIERSFNAPKELVFSMFIDADHISRWFGPAGWKTTVYEMELIPGGVWHYCMRSPDGEEAWGKAIYREISPPDRLVYVDMFSDEQGNEAAGMPSMLISTVFSSDGDGSKLVSHTKFESQEELQKIIDMQAVEGIVETYDRLDSYLNGLQKS